MPVDFEKLPPEEPESEKPPSRFVWTIVFFVLVLAGVIAVLLLWPKGEPTQTPWFWTCVTVYPFGLAAFVVLRRYSVFEGRRLDAIAWNKAREDHVNEVFSEASRPLAVLAATCRFSSEPKDDDLRKLLDGSVKLEPQTPPKPDSPPVNARWFEKPDADESGIRFKHDNDRQRYILTWAFSTVTDAISEAIRSLPMELRLETQLILPGIVDADEALAGWPQHEDLVLQDAGENGDGTVPIRSGRAPAGQTGVQVCVAYPGVEHEGAYKERPQQLFALWAVTRIVANVKGTSLEYKC
jgi:hypothetical protein